MATFWRYLAPAARSLPLRCSRACNGLRREQAFVDTKPHVDFDIENDFDELMVGIAIINAGPGPAAIKAVTFYVDRKPVAEAHKRTPSCRRPNSITKSWSRVTRWRFSLRSRNAPILLITVGHFRRWTSGEGNSCPVDQRAIVLQGQRERILNLLRRLAHLPTLRC